MQFQHSLVHQVGAVDEVFGNFFGIDTFVRLYIFAPYLIFTVAKVTELCSGLLVVVVDQQLGHFGGKKCLFAVEQAENRGSQHPLAPDEFFQVHFSLKLTLSLQEPAMELLAVSPPAAEQVS